MLLPSWTVEQSYVEQFADITPTAPDSQFQMNKKSAKSQNALWTYAFPL